MMKHVQDQASMYQAKQTSVQKAVNDILGLAEKYSSSQREDFWKSKEYLLKEKELEKKYGELEDIDTVNAYVDQVKGGLNINNIPTEYRNKVVKELSSQGLNEDKIKKSNEGKQTIVLMSRIKSMWDKISASGFPTGGPYGVLGGIKGQLGEMKIEPDVQVYEDYRKGIISTLRGMVGEKGILSNQDMERIEKLLPRLNATAGQGKSKWTEIEALLSEKYGKEITSSFFGSSSTNGSVMSIGKYKVEVE